MLKYIESTKSAKEIEMTIKDACKQLNERCKGVDILSLDPKEVIKVIKAEKFTFNAGKTTPGVGDDYSTNYWNNLH